MCCGARRPQTAKTEHGRRAAANGAPPATREHRADDSALADTTSDLQIFARTGRIEMDTDALAQLLAQPGFASERFIQTHMAQLNTAGLEHARHELDRFMTHVQNKARPTPCHCDCRASMNVNAVLYKSAHAYARRSMLQDRASSETYLTLPAPLRQ